MGAAIAERQRRVCAMLQSYSGPLERKVEGLLNYLYWVLNNRLCVQSQEKACKRSEMSSVC